jgi:coenzyme F420-reducing hydrogenase beta subunit
MCPAGGTKGCPYCIDYANEFSDISVGTLGVEKGTAVLVIRSETGKKLFDLAVKDKKIKKVSDEPDIEKIIAQASKKKKRNINNILKLNFGKIGYLELNQKELASYFGL